MKILIIIVAVIGGAGVFFFLSIFLRMAFVGEITEFQLIFAPEKNALYEGILITEISRDEKPWPNEGYLRSHSTGDIQPAEEMVLLDDGQLSPEKRVFDKDPGKEVLVIKGENRKPGYIFGRNRVFLEKKGRSGDLFGSFSHPELSIVRHVSHLNEKYFLLAGDPTTYKYAYSCLWQVEKDDLGKKKIAEDIYFTFVRPPMIFRPEGFGGQVVVYYTGSVNYGFGGDSSRPEFSYIRIYNESYPEGIDIAKFGFKAGTIVHIKWDKNAIIATGDPSRPGSANKKPRNARIWKVELSGKTPSPGKQETG